MNYELESVADVGGEVDYRAEERIGGAAVPMTVETENSAEEEVAEIVGGRTTSGEIHRGHIFLPLKGVFITMGEPDGGCERTVDEEMWVYYPVESIAHYEGITFVMEMIGRDRDGEIGEEV